MIPDAQEARRIAMIKAGEELEEFKRVSSEERSAWVEDSEAAAAVAATHVQTIEELTELEAKGRHELENAR